MINLPSDTVYLDHAAASPPSEHALDLFRQYATSCFANQEAIHQAAYLVRRQLAEHEERMLAAWCGPAHDALVQWTDSGTASLQNLLRYPMFAAGDVVTTAAEHAALTAAIGWLGIPVKIVRLCRGLVDLDHLAELLTPATRLVAIHHVQSEIGAVQDLCAIRRVIDANAPQAWFLADTIQSAGKLELPWAAARLDAAVISGYKVGVPGGGAIVFRDRGDKSEKLSAFFHRLRGEEHRISRPNPSLCLTLAQIMAESAPRLTDDRQRIAELHRDLRQELRRRWDDKIKFVVDETAVSPYILHFLVPGYQGAVLVRMMSEQRVFIASGSACNAETRTPSPALLAAGVGAKNAFAGIRLSFSPATTAADLARFLDAFDICLKNY